MKVTPKSAAKSKARIVVTDAAGHASAVAPVPARTPSRLHPRHILVPMDFSAAAGKALTYAEAFASTFGAKLTLLHVLEPMVLPSEFGYSYVPTPEEESRQLEALKKKLNAAAAALETEASTRCEVRIGRPWQEIVEAAREGDVDLLIITTHGRTGLKHVLMGSVAEKIVRHATCPVLVVRPEEKDFVG
jgi:universal stress protein A